MHALAASLTAIWQAAQSAPLAIAAAAALGCCLAWHAARRTGENLPPDDPAGDDPA